MKHACISEVGLVHSESQFVRLINLRNVQRHAWLVCECESSTSRHGRHNEWQTQTPRSLSPPHRA